MKITDIKIYAAEYAQTSKSLTNKKWVFLKMETDQGIHGWGEVCLLYTSPSPRDRTRSRMPSSA